LPQYWPGADRGSSRSRLYSWSPSWGHDSRHQRKYGVSSWQHWPDGPMRRAEKLPSDWKAPIAIPACIPSPPATRTQKLARTSPCLHGRWLAP
jgi:hypothetical protein